MKIKIFLKRIFVSVFLVSMFLSNHVFASTLNGDTKGNISVKTINENSILVSSNKNKERITVIENTNTRKVSILNIETGKESYLLLNKIDGTIYSSITNKSIKLSDEITTRAKTEYSTVWISYKQIKDAVGTTTTFGGLAGLILLKVPGAHFIAGAMGAISTIVGAGNWFVPEDSNHGLKITVKTVKYYRTRLGMRNVYKIVKSISSIKKY